MEIDFELKNKIFKEFLEDGGYGKLNDAVLLKDMLKCKSLPNGKPDESTFSPLVKAAINAIVAEQLQAPLLSEHVLSEYQTLLQKEVFFEQITIETKEEFDKFFEDFSQRENVLFRGLNEAKYRLYSSLQRNWIMNRLKDKHPSYKDYLQKLVSNAKSQQGGLLPKYFESIGIDSANEIAVLSFLQHYGCPTPLLDWTYSFLNALFFAIENVKPGNGKYEIENYCCVYFLEEEFMDNNSLPKIVQSSFSSKIETIKNRLAEDMDASGFTDEQRATFTDERILEMFLRQMGQGAMTHLAKIEFLMRAPLLYFSDKNVLAPLPKYSVNNNFNIINQQGVFTWNNHPTKPLEHMANDEAQNGEESRNWRFSKCVNINKELAPYIRAKLDTLGIDKEFIYPNPEKIAQVAFTHTV